MLNKKREITTGTLDRLAALIKRERDSLLSKWRQQVCQLPSARHLGEPTLDDHMPAFLDELAAAFESGSKRTIPETLAAVSPKAHGLQRLKDGFDIEEVVAEYSILRGCIYDLAERDNLPLEGKPFQILYRVFDRAIGMAVQAYATWRALEVRQRREEYLAFVAHDLRTPLTTISMAGRVLEAKLATSDAPTLQMLRALRRSVQQLEGLVSKVLEENTSLQTEIGIKLERREFHLWPFVEALTHDLHPVAGTNSTRLHNEVPEELTVCADANLLRRILQNLLANAIKYTPRGDVVIGARQSGADGSVECWVRDNGAGIAGELLGRIFEKGETDPENTEGKGLGLAIVKAFTEAHGGKVVAESKEGAGSTFRFTLPARGSANGGKT